ncbi:unnamed protein product [Rotaria sp. Silwood1]|nr:unnamed protein product [Rotaria sp. Silwood1]CAF4976392.1 unnamed protein product [Rotaria sp. Silwood1]
MTESIIFDRFFDAAKDLDQALTHIEGYEKYRLVSLTEAIVPIISLLYNADSMVEIAERNSREPTDGLTSDESGAIHLYRMQCLKPHPSIFTLLDKRLYSQDRSSLIS